MQARTGDYEIDPALMQTPHAPLKPAAVLAALVTRPEGLSVLLTRRSDTLARHSGQVAFPGGRAEPGEQPWETALREAEEERERTALRAAIEPAGAVGSAFAVGPALATHASMMVLQLEREILSALSMLGAVAATAYLAVAVSQPKTGRARRGLANRTIKRMGLATWLHETLEPLLRNHASRVTADTKSLIEQQTGEQVEIPDIVVQRMGREAARYLRVRSNLEPQVKDAIIKAIEEGIEGGDDVAATAKRIEALVSAGRFTHGGARRRAQMLARDQTANMQRAASLAAYESMDSIAAIRLKDGIYGPPRSDQACIHRDGEIVPIEDAGSVQPLHPLCTLGFEPVVSNVSTELGRELGVA